MTMEWAFSDYTSYFQRKQKNHSHSVPPLSTLRGRWVTGTEVKHPEFTSWQNSTAEDTFTWAQGLKSRILSDKDFPGGPVVKRVHLPTQGTWVWSLIQEDPTCRGATEPVNVTSTAPVL